MTRIPVRRADQIAAAGRSEPDAGVVRRVHEIAAEVRSRGDAALAELTAELDGADVRDGIEVPRAELEAARTAIPAELLAALERMAERLRALHARQLPAPWEAEEGGVRFGEVVRPLGSVGCYVPGGRAGYPSSVLMTVVPARVAGVGRVVVCTPPGADGSVRPEVLAAAAVAEADAVYRVGGAQAIAALAYGTESIAAVDAIVGPGNAWVTEAKRAVSGAVGIDGLAGPTELVIVAGADADPGVLAADLVAQAEHDPEARVTLIALARALPDRVNDALAAEVEASPRRDVVEASLAGAAMVVTSSEDDAATLVDRLAPEHLQVITPDPRAFLDRVRSFGAAFLGPDTPVSFGDYGVGSNHVLPTMGTARFASGLRAADFVTVSSFVEASPAGVAAFADDVELVAAAEGLPAHARAAAVRR